MSLSLWSCVNLGFCTEELLLMIPWSWPGGVLLVQNKGIRAWAKMCSVGGSLWTLQALYIFPNGTHRASAWGCCPSTPKLLDLSTLQLTCIFREGHWWHSMLSDVQVTEPVSCWGQWELTPVGCAQELMAVWLFWAKSLSPTQSLSTTWQLSVSAGQNQNIQFWRQFWAANKREEINIYICVCE